MGRPHEAREPLGLSRHARAGTFQSERTSKVVRMVTDRDVLLAAPPPVVYAFDGIL
jgi:hypothetical protein